MIGKQIGFTLLERKNRYRESGKEYAFNVSFVGQGWWTFTTWEKKPSDVIVEEMKDVVLRSFEFYHRHLAMPDYDIKVVDG